MPHLKCAFFIEFCNAACRVSCFCLQSRKKNKKKKTRMNTIQHDKKVIPIRSEVLQLMLTDNKNDLNHFDTQPLAKVYHLFLLALSIWNGGEVYPKLKFIYSEKAKTIWEIFTLLLSYVVPVKSKVKISPNFLAFSEYMNFNFGLTNLPIKISLQKFAQKAFPKRW